MQNEDTQGMIQPAPTTCFDVYCHAATWVLAFALDTGRHGHDSPVGGLSLSADEMDAIRLPMVGVIAALSGERPPADGPPLDLEYWKSAILQYSVCDHNSQIQHRHPGDPIPQNTRLHMVEFGKNVKSVPFECIVANIENVAASHAIASGELLFTYRGENIRDANQLFCEVRLRPCDIKRITNALDQWRECVKRRVASATVKVEQSEAECDADGAIPMPDCLRGRILPSTEIAALLKRTRKTLRLWERQGYGPQGLPWPAGKHVTGNMVIYDLEQIWKSVSFYLERNFNHDRRWMGALLQASFKIGDKKYSLLDELAEKEEREGGTNIHAKN